MNTINYKEAKQLDTISVTFVKPFDDKYDLKEASDRLSVLHECCKKAKNELKEEVGNFDIGEELISIQPGCIKVLFRIFKSLAGKVKKAIENIFNVDIQINSKKQQTKVKEGIYINGDVNININICKFENVITDETNNNIVVIEPPKIRTNQKYSFEVTCLVCDKFIESFVKEKSGMSLNEFVNRLNLSNISKSSLRDLALNIVWLLNSRNIDNQYKNIKGLPNTSKMTKFVLEVLLFQNGLIKY